jgi:O-antigen ligase
MMTTNAGVAAAGSSSAPTGAEGAADMAANIDWTRWAWPAVLACVAAPVGILAGINPEMAIAAAIGLAFLLAVFADLANGVALFTFITFFETVPGITGGTSITKVAGALLALAWLATLATRADAKSDFLRQHPMITGVLVLFLAWAGLSFAWSENPSGAVEATYRLALNALLLLIVYTAVRTRRDAIHVLIAFVVGACAAVAVGLASGSGPTPYGEAARFSSSSENANELASTLVATLVLALGLAYVARRSPALRIVALGAAAFAMFGIVLTVSRSGLIALGCAALAAVVLSGRWRPKALALAATVATVAVVYFAAFAPDVARERVTEVDSANGRQDIWKVAWRMVEDEPVRGVGAGNFQTASIHYLLVPGGLQRSDFIVDTQKVAHNVYLGTLAELGVVGLALLVAVILGLFSCGLQAARQFERNGDRDMEILARAILVALVGLLAALFFSSDAYKKQLWLLLALGPALLAIARLGSPRLGSPSRSR